MLQNASTLAMMVRGIYCSGPAQMLTQGAGQLLPTQVRKELHRFLYLRQVFAGKSPPGKHGLG